MRTENINDEDILSALPPFAAEERTRPFGSFVHKRHMHRSKKHRYSNYLDGACYTQRARLVRSERRFATSIGLSIAANVLCW